MTTEHDEQLSSLYKQTRQDMPAAHIDDAILAAARRETASHPRPAFAPFSGGWRVPAALAAVLVLTIGLVNLMEHDTIPVNGYEPFAMDESDKLALNEEKQERAAARPAMKPAAEPDAHATEPAQAGQLALQAPLAQSPAVVAAVEGDDSRRLAKRLADQAVQEQSARKDKPQALAEAIPAKTKTLAAKTVAPVPTINEISALRLAGKVAQANRAADAFIRHHFGEDLDKIDAKKVTLPVQEQEKFIAELRLLGREPQARQLQQLMSDR